MIEKLNVSSYTPCPKWLSEEGLQTLQRGYLLPEETPRDLYARIAYTASKYLGRKDLQQDFFDILYHGFLGLSTPVASNFGTTRGLPISCFSNSISDNIPSIYSHLKEVAMMSKNGGGVGCYYGNIRPSGSPISKGGVSTGIVPVVRQYDQCANYVSQGSVRRGSFAHYLNIEHPDAYELLLAKDHLDGDPRDMIDGNIAFTVPDRFLEKVLQNDPIAVKVWSKALEMNQKVGSPYFIFIDNVNRQNPPAYINHGLKVETSNLCSEVMLYTDENHSFVCCLSSLNLFKWDEWKNWRGMNSGKSVVELSIYLLDAVMEEFIKRAKNMTGMGRAVRSAEKGRALGLGAMGIAYLYQKKMLPFKSKEARELNREIFKTIQQQATKASQNLANEYGEPVWCEGTGMRNTHLCVEGSTKILTKKGNIPIKDLVDKEVEVWNGIEWSIVKPFKTRENTELLKVDLDGEYSLTCTPDHKWLIQNSRHKSEVEVLTSNLRVGDKLAKWNLPIINGEKVFNYAYTAGFFTGDGSYNKSKPQCRPRKEIRLNNDKHQCISKIIVKDGCSIRTTVKGGLRFYIPNEVPDKFVVPSINTKLEDKLNWLAGYFDADGSYSGSLISINKECLQAVKEMSASCGLFSRLSKEKGKSTYRLQFSPCELTILNAYTLRVKFKDSVQKRQRLKILAITKVANADSYCFTDNLNGTGLFNLIYTKQCAIAPTRTNSIISGAFSPGIEPIDNNYYTAKQAKGSFVRKNGLLKTLLQSKGKDTPEIWNNILEKNGSVMHLDCLTIDEKLVFLTAREIDPEELIRQAATRAPYICQGVSLNRYTHPDLPIKKLNELTFKVWYSGSKSIYYTKSSSEKIINKVKNEAHIITSPNCIYCERAKNLFNELDIQYTEYNREDVTYFPWKSVPQIWYQTHYIGGYEDFVDIINVQQSNSIISQTGRIQYKDKELEDCDMCAG